MHLRIAIISIAVFLAIGSANGQTALTCPEISVTGPAGVTQPGDVMDFTAQVRGDLPNGVRYHWTLADDGEILHGQGTLNLRVQTPKKLYFNVTATLEVFGLSQGCTNSFSETAPVACRCIPVLVDEFTALPLREQMSRLDAAVGALRERPTDRLVFIEYFPPKTSKAAVVKRINWLSGELKRRHKLPASNFEIITADASFDGRRRTRIYRIPPGAEIPGP